jgi:hypothetical protein
MTQTYLRVKSAGIEKGTDLPSKLRPGKPVTFDDGVGISQGKCFPLYSGDKLVTWLDSMHATGSKLFVRRRLEDASITGTPAGSKGGAIEDAYDELVASDGRTEPFVYAADPFSRRGTRQSSHSPGLGNSSFDLPSADVSKLQPTVSR